MSDLYKAFLKRTKDQDATLRSVIEDEEDEENETVANIPTNKYFREDQETIDRYREFKSTTFTRNILCMEDRKICTYFKPSTKPGALLVCHHGAGSSSMTFAELSRSFTDDSISILLFDMRGHGDSQQVDLNFSLDMLVSDVKEVISDVVERHSPMSIFLLGHSLGGAVFAKYATEYPNDLIKGLILLDIVEETAVSSLSAMPQFISRMPLKFTSLREAIQWHMRHLLNNRVSAELSVPDLLDLTTLSWKADLSSTEPFWESWFRGLSKNFLLFKGAKLLILSAHETLDKTLIIGQMQGKYQLVVFNNSEKAGHFVHEDLPVHVAQCVTDFIQKTTSPEKFMKDNLGFVPKWGGNIHT
ncbi:PPE1 [Candida oxycetoniae]|uniref:Protein phosphatase methylesterase 1 n=1 Tax=Candida oxycetoniae TaxID=497107 RepID=A0AAI9SWJ2_9ASCO|nr:PPE1 [Candida oxycetoniae]KAI3404421.2 PPE1 [Candida oxycetoniae]